MEESGFYNILKPPGMTSHDVVAYLRRRLAVKKMGHGGTLDPLACGVLVCLANGATRLSSNFSALDKTYIAHAVFGFSTDSGDLDGVVTKRKAGAPSREAVEAVLPRFTGSISQLPPMVSAVKVGGERLYKAARQGIEVERKPRTVTVKRLELKWFSTGECARAVFSVECSGGTYIRTLVEDIGAAAGFPAVTAFLVRTAVGPFRIADSLRPEETANAGNPASLLLPPEIIKEEYRT